MALLFLDLSSCKNCSCSFEVHPASFSSIANERSWTNDIKFIKCNSIVQLKQVFVTFSSNTNKANERLLRTHLYGLKKGPVFLTASDEQFHMHPFTFKAVHITLSDITTDLETRPLPLYEPLNLWILQNLFIFSQNCYSTVCKCNKLPGLHIWEFPQFQHL